MKYFDSKISPRWPIYVISKGRYDIRRTDHALVRLGAKCYVICEEAEYDLYKASVNPEMCTVLILPTKYFDEYDVFDDEIGKGNGTGPGAARNFAWDHSIGLGAKRHWVMDDNAEDFYRLNKNLRIRVRTPAIFRCCEDFVDRYSNVPVAGLNYRFFCPSDSERPAYYLNTRIYSFLLIENTCKYRWRGRYNEDTDLSLRVLKDGDCTIQFNAFLAGKAGTQAMKGGNTEVFYGHEGTYNKSKMLADMHPDVARVMWRWGRWHHWVDYRPFKRNKLIRDPNIEIPTELVNNYGMKLCELDENGKFTKEVVFND